MNACNLVREFLWEHGISHTFQEYDRWWSVHIVVDSKDISANIDRLVVTICSHQDKCELFVRKRYWVFTKLRANRFVVDLREPGSLDELLGIVRSIPSLV